MLYDCTLMEKNNNKKKNFCAKHMPRAELVGWDAEKEEEVLLGK